MLGDFEAAIREREWLINHRGLALVEGRWVSSVVQNVIDWNLAFLRLGQLHEHLGQHKKAIGYYQQFLNQWRGMNPPSLRRDAQQRLEKLLAQ